MKLYNKVNLEWPVIAWWSGGITSAVACNLAAEWFGIDNVLFVFCDTLNEDDDTYRFKKDCEVWYGKEIISLRNDRYPSIKDVWRTHLSLNVATGAKCSSELKRVVREEFTRNQPFSYQVFGFDRDEINRAVNLKLNNPEIRPIFPLIIQLMNKKQCIQRVKDQLIEVPASYKAGFLNNNCLKTGCVQGGIGYWQKIRIDRPDLFDAMADEEHLLSRLKGQPVTMLKDQSKGGGLVFLKHNPQFPNLKDISMMKGQEPKPLMECNGFCGINDGIHNPTKNEINWEDAN